MKKCLALVTVLALLLTTGFMAVASAEEQITLNFWHIWPTDQMNDIITAWAL